MDEGESPLFPPQFDFDQARGQLQHLVAQSPQNFGHNICRWQLQTIKDTVFWLEGLSLPGVWRHLKRAGITLKKGREYVHSPDPEYLEKLAEVVRLLKSAITSKGKIVVLFADELTFYRQPTLASAYDLVGKHFQPLAQRSQRSNTSGRIGGAVNALSGQVNYVLASKCGLKQLLNLYEQIADTYPDAELIYLVEDNWSVHFHPTILAALPPQETRFELKVSRSWANAKVQPWTKNKLPIQIVPLPTYASWCNPIEKLWRWLKQAVIHLHKQADQWDVLKEQIKMFLNRFEQASAELLKYIGLTENSNLYAEAISLLREKPT